MVVSRKRKDARMPKKSHNTPFSILSYAHPHISPKEPLESNILEKELSGPSIIKGSEGKRKAHAELDSSPSIEDKELNTSLNGSAHTGQGQESLRPWTNSALACQRQNLTATQSRAKKTLLVLGRITLHQIMPSFQKNAIPLNPSGLSTSLRSSPARMVNSSSVAT